MGLGGRILWRGFGGFPASGALEAGGRVGRGRRVGRGAFTLIELLIVILIIAILALIAVPNFLEMSTRAKIARTKADMRALAAALEAYYVDRGDVPIPASTHCVPSCGVCQP